MDEEVAVEVALPGELLYDIDQFAARHGYENPSAVVREAIATAGERASGDRE
jgi:metal-responsive CopG/Arc/MetJ family transcriptional regulator